ncbi:hypothetical protein ACSP97_00260 [Streptomyces sp. SCPE 10]|uniref:hypothetical protein n=1 Tax=Streptomyces sp. SCPE 10 TaxID=3449273 RepID=UPI003F80FBCA
MNDPTVLLVDESTRAPDHERGVAVLDLITRLTHHQATATVLVTHDRTHLATVDKIAEVHFGVPVDLPIDGPPGKLRQPAVKRADDLLHYGQVRDYIRRCSPLRAWPCPWRTEAAPGGQATGPKTSACPCSRAKAAMTWPPSASITATSTRSRPSRARCRVAAGGAARR